MGRKSSVTKMITQVWCPECFAPNEWDVDVFKDVDDLECWKCGITYSKPKMIEGLQKK